ncbi:hypothetical protein L6R53_26025 [Myxococcota bacterium]|nr:hypothetical protein [Myxococcota bacterium]
MLAFMTSLWRGWKSFAHGLIKGQNWLLMAIAYVVALGPVSIFIKLSRRKLDRGPADPDAKTYGLSVAQAPMDVRRAQRQF